MPGVDLAASRSSWARKAPSRRRHRRQGQETTVKYLMIVCIDPAITATGNDPEDTDAWVAEMDGRGVRREGRPRAPGEATPVRVRAGEVLISDGPFAETKEVMVGYDML